MTRSDRRTGTPRPTDAPKPDDAQRFSRRQMLLGVGGAAVAGLAAGAGSAIGLTAGGGSLFPTGESDGIGDPSTTGSPVAETGSPVAAAGRHQAGVARPATPQRNALLAVNEAPPTAILAALPAVGDLILRMVGEGPYGTADPLIAQLFPDGAGDLSISVGVGSRVLAASDAATDLQGVLDLPLFAGDAQLEPHALGGDLLISASASNATVLDPAFQAISELVPGIRVLWSEHGFRGPGEGTIARSPLGFFDGVIVPRGEAEMNENVWITHGPLAGGTICVMRRFVLKTREFGALDIETQNRVMGRDRASGAPLSGGTLRDEVDLLAKTATGEYVIPPDAHVRAAHPSFTGSDLMLRRSYAYSVPGTNGVPESGLMFISFQREVGTFSRTQLRLDETDALMRFARATATAAFAILPGFNADTPLGATLIGR